MIKKNIYENLAKLFLNFILIYAEAAIADSAIIPDIQTSTSLSANEGAAAEPGFDNQEYSLENKHLLELEIIEIQRKILAQEEKTFARVNELEGLISEQRATINHLKIKLESMTDKPVTNGTTFEVWSGILLACVAVIVTVLGVVVALISLFGYKELIEKGTESASLAAAKQTKLEFDRFIAKGRLDSVIAESINKIVYRGLYNDPAENETDEPDHEQT